MSNITKGQAIFVDRAKEQQKAEIYKADFTVYVPEYHGFSTGSNNGNYVIVQQFIYNQNENKFYARTWTSCDIENQEEFEEITEPEFFNQIVVAWEQEQKEEEEREVV
jgi:hypothetical protein